MCRGTTLEYTPDDSETREGAVVLEHALTNDRKALTGMGTKVLIWPDKKAFDTETGELSELGAVWEIGEAGMTVTPCDTEGKTYTPGSVGETEPEAPEDGQPVPERRPGDTLRQGQACWLKVTQPKTKSGGDHAAIAAHPLATFVLVL